MPCKHKKKQPGYTLVEMLVVVAILLIIVPVLFASINSLYKTHSRTLSRAFALVGTTNSVKEITRGIRAASYAENGAVPIVSIATSSLIMYTDSDYDGKVERVRYYLDNTTIWKGTIEPTATSSYPENTEVITKLTDNIINNETNTAVFKYYTSTSTEITSTSNILNIRRVSVTLIGSYKFSNEKSEIKIKSSASIRNLKNIY